MRKVLLLAALCALAVLTVAPAALAQDVLTASDSPTRKRPRRVYDARPERPQRAR